MSTFINVHVIQSVPPSNLNRDDSGTPKTAIFGGVKRHRVSSQAWKAAIRKEFQSSMRSQRSASLIEGLVRKHGSTKDMENLGKVLVNVLFKNANKKDRIFVGADGSTSGEKTPNESEVAVNGVMFAYSPQAVAKITEIFSQRAEGKLDDAEVNKGISELVEIVNHDLTLDIALFGRMATGDDLKTVESAIQMSHAISTHKVSPEYDFFTAQDELREDEGSGHLGNHEFVSSTLYRHVSLNVDKLKENLAGIVEIDEAINAFLSQFLTTVPGGKTATFFGSTAPDSVYVTVESAPVTLVNGFETPVRAGDSGYIKPSIEALFEEAEVDFRGRLVTDEVDRLAFFRRKRDEVEVVESVEICDSLSDIIERAVEKAL